jgi:predicted Zn-dependent protease
MDIYDRLPDSAKKDKSFLLIRFFAASALGEKQYDDAIQAFRQFHPGDPCLDLLGLDNLFIHKKYTKARSAINRIDEAIGGDPYLNVARANSYLGEKRYPEAIQFARKAIEEEKDLPNSYWTLVTVSLRTKDFAETTRLLGVLQNELGIRLGDLTGIPEYSDYVKSSEHAQWLKQWRRLPASPKRRPSSTGSIK